jgi:glycosyltransferase involved in cell wall biosynthesis
MRILMLNYEFPPLGGGAANATHYLLKEFAGRPDVEIDLVTSSVDRSRTEKFAPNITIYHLDIGKKGNPHYQSSRDLLVYSWKAYWLGRKLKKERRFNLCHAFFGIPCGYVAMKLGLPYVVSLRGSDVPFYNKRFYWPDKLVFRRLSRKIWRRAKRVVANSEKLRELALASAPEQAIDVIPNGVDTDFFRPAPSRHCDPGHEPGEAIPPTEPTSTTPPPPSRRLKLVSTGRLIERKGFRYLLEAMIGLDAELTVIGDGNLKDELVEMAREKNVDADFVGLKGKDEVLGLLQAADVFVLPSLNEGMSNAILEAMACGLPIVATETGGTAELVKGGESGLVVPKADSGALAEAIRRFIDYPEETALMGVASRQQAEKMSWIETANRYLTTYL